jgi:hypothetical protein
MFIAQHFKRLLTAPGVPSNLGGITSPDPIFAVLRFFLCFANGNLLRIGYTTKVGMIAFGGDIFREREKKEGP